MNNKIAQLGAKVYYVASDNVTHWGEVTRTSRLWTLTHGRFGWFEMTDEDGTIYRIKHTERYTVETSIDDIRLTAHNLQRMIRYMFEDEEMYQTLRDAYSNGIKFTDIPVEKGGGPGEFSLLDELMEPIDYRLD